MQKKNRTKVISSDDTCSLNCILAHMCPCQFIIFFKLLITASEAVSLKYLRSHLLNIPRFNEKLVIIALNSSRVASQP